VPRATAFQTRRVPGARASARREHSCTRGVVVEAPESQMHLAFGINMSGGAHRRAPNRADAPTFDQYRPMRVFVAIAVFRGDIDTINAVVVMLAAGGRPTL
jgi:hypothetical protein